MEHSHTAAVPVNSEIEQLRVRLAALERELLEYRRSEEEYADVLRKTGIALQWVSPDGTILWASPGQLQLTGYSREEYAGLKARNIYDFSEDRIPVWDCETRLRRKDGSMRYVAVTTTSHFRDRELHHTTWLTRDITDRTRSEIRLAVQLAVSQLLTEHQSIATAAPAVLQKIGEQLEFDCGSWWTTDGTTLRCTQIWRRNLLRLEAFVNETRACSFRLKQGLPGRVWATHAPAWVQTLQADANFPRSEAAAAAGLHCGIAFPITAGEECLGVVEFFTSVKRPPDLQLLDALAALGCHIGQFIKRRQAEVNSEVRAEHLQILYEMADAMIRAGSVDDIHDQALQTLEKLLGVERASILLADQHAVMRFKRWRGLSAEYRSAVEGHSPWSPDDPNPEPILVPDVTQAPELSSYVSAFRREGIAALVFVPLVSRGRLLGTFMLYHSQPHAMAEADIALVRTIASHVAVAIERKETEAALEEQQTRLQLALLAARTGVWEWDINANRIIWSDRVYEIHGIPRGGISGTPEDLVHLFHPDDRVAVRDAVMEAVRTRGSYSVEFRILRPDGELRWIATSGRVVCDEQGRPVRMIGTTVDVTERKLAVDTLSENAATIRALLESAAQGIISVSEDGTIVCLNQMAERLFGYSRNELAGQKLEILIPERLRHTHTDHRSRYNEHPHARPMGAGLELTALHKDGTEFPVEISLSSIHTRNGLLAVSFITDITARKQAERELRESEARYRTLFEHSNDALGVSVDEKFAYVNPAFARMFGYGSPDDFIGVSIYDNVPQEHHTAIQRHRLERQRVGSLDPVLYQGAGRRRDGTEFVTEIRASDFWMNGKLHTLVILRDITAERQAEEALAEQAAALARSNADLQQFAYASSHDLQEPLRNIAAYTQLLARRYGGQLDTDADQFIGNIVSGCQRMEALIKDLLVFSRVSSSEPAAFGPVDMQAALLWAEKNLEMSIAETGAEVTSSGLPPVYGDQVQLVQLLQNLLGNALKYRQGTPHIRVSATRNGTEWRFCVKDNGVGIAPEYHERIFGLFKRLHGRDIPGTGVGLAICKRIVEKHGGRIWVESAPGRGSAFFFSLPAQS